MEFVVEANPIIIIIEMRFNPIEVDCWDCGLHRQSAGKDNEQNGKNVLLDNEHVRLADIGLDWVDEQGAAGFECAEHSFWC